jgi:biopolymer transport protein ExbD
MARRKKKQRQGGGAEEVNLTPMIDCTFQLIIFFVLTAQMASEQTKLVPPYPHKTIAIKAEEGKVALPNRVVISVANKFGDAPADERDKGLSAVPQFYRVGAGNKIDIGDMETLKQIIEQRKAQSASDGYNPDDFVVEIRADKDIAFGGIEPILRAAAEVKITKMAITAIAEQ